MSSSYPNRAEVVRRLQEPGAPTVASMSEETGIPKGTLYYWLSRSTPAGTDRSLLLNGNPGMRKRSKTRTPALKLRLVAESMALSGDTLRTWCEREGITVDELLGWRDLALSGIEEASGASTGKSREELETQLSQL